LNSFEDDISALAAHLRQHAVKTDGPYTLRSGAESSWYIDARQTTFSGAGARLVGAAMLARIPDDVDAVGGMTMGADPIATATAIAAAERGLELVSFSIRKEAKDHGLGGRLVGPVNASSRVVVLEDTISTGAALSEAIAVLRGEGVTIVKAISLVDRSGGAASDRMDTLGVTYESLITSRDLGVEN